MDRKLLMETMNAIAESYTDSVGKIETTCRDSVKSAREKQRADFMAVTEQHPAEKNYQKARQEADRLFPLVDGKDSAERQAAFRQAFEDYGIALKARDKAIEDLRTQHAGDYGKEIADAEQAEKRAIAILDDALSAYVSASAIAVIEAAQKRALKEIASHLGSSVITSLDRTDAEAAVE